MKTEPRIDPLFKLTNKKAIVVDELLDGRTKGLIDEPERTGLYKGQIFYLPTQYQTPPQPHTIQQLRCSEKPVGEA